MASRRAQAHAKHASHCSCGKIVHGNGARYQHRAMHERAEDEHRYVRRDYYFELFPDYEGGGSDRRVPGLREPGR
jgi:hypothetical protein